MDDLDSIINNSKFVAENFTDEQWAPWMQNYFLKKHEYITQLKNSLLNSVCISGNKRMDPNS